MRSPTLALIVALVGGCAGPHAARHPSYVEPADMALVVGRGELPELVVAYERFIDPARVPDRDDAASYWLVDKPAELREFDALAAAAAARLPPEEAAAAWLLAGNAWLYVAEHGRRLQPPRYAEANGSLAWNEVVARAIDARFGDLELEGLARLTRCVELSGGEGRYAAQARTTIAVLQARRHAAPDAGKATIGLPLLGEAPPNT